jgi:drug/metabolite transporter (DMT)-like permease
MNKDKLHSIILLVILSLIWGSSFILIKKGLIGYSPAQVGALRVVIAALVFVPYIIRYFKKINLKTYGFILLFGLMEIGIPPYLYAFAQTVVNSSTAGILNSLVPLFTLLTGFIIFRVSVNSYKVIGVILGLIGAVLLVFFKSGDFSSVDFSNSWGLLIVLATLLYGLGRNILKEYLQDISDIQITALAFVSMGIPSGVYLFSTDFIYITINEPTVLPSFF